jgi:hypothetical protein
VGTAVDYITVVVFIVAQYVVGIWAIIDAVQLPASAFQAIGSNRRLWIVGLAVAFFIPFGFVAGALYLLVTRVKIRRRMEQSGSEPDLRPRQP